jgi:hypothetical protein
MSKPKGKTDSSASDNSSDNSDVLIAFPGCAFDDSLSILDSACSYHVCINKDLFLLMNQSRMEVLFGWMIILLVKLLAWALCRSRCLTGCSHIGRSATCSIHV